VESAIFSERNVFRYSGGGPSLAVADYGGEWFRDTGSWFNGRPARLNTVASGLGLGNDVGWDPAEVYDYRALTSPSAVERYVLRHAGTGRSHGHP
jgi:pectate lyase